ncbi:MAG: hypothetical protein K6B45_09465, partial [Bacteroidaceae bacterium]|nr:hypothetical protein [Bacteroidaceae bacterium]
FFPHNCFHFINNCIFAPDEGICLMLVFGFVEPEKLNMCISKTTQLQMPTYKSVGISLLVLCTGCSGPTKQRARFDTPLFFAL